MWVEYSSSGEPAISSTAAKICRAQAYASCRYVVQDLQAAENKCGIVMLIMLDVPRLWRLLLGNLQSMGLFPFAEANDWRSYTIASWICASRIGDVQ